MSIECGECERDLRGGHDKSCSRCPPEDRLLAEAIELLRNATYVDGQATVLTKDCEALQKAIDDVRREQELE